MNLHKSTCLVLAAVILAAGAGSARADYDSARGWFSAKPKRERLLIQEALMALELYEGPADGLFGARTYRALVDFEDDVRADGVLSAAQQASLLDGGDGAGSSGSKSDESVTAWSGSGFAISDESILTNYHVVEGCRAIQVAGLGEATVVSSDKLHASPWSRSRGSSLPRRSSRPIRSNSVRR